MKSFFLIAAVLAALPPVDFESAVLLLSGASCLEDLDEDTLERFRDLELRPVELNGASRSRLLSCGLFNAFQVASFMDWKDRSGDILSYTELGLLDGFSPEIAEALRLFTRLESGAPPGARSSGRFHNDLILRASVKENDGLAAAAGLRWKGSIGDRAELNWATRSSYGDPAFGIGTVSAAYYGRRYLGKLVLGHFNARFGQGLAMWSGMSLSRYSSINSFRRNGSGFSPTGSFSPSHCGVAADFDLGKWGVGAAYSFTEKQAMAAVSWTGRRLSLGAFAGGRSASVDFKLGLKNTSLFGELAWVGKLSAIGGVIWTPAYQRNYGVLLSWNDGSPEFAAAVGTKQLDCVFALTANQLRCTAKYSLKTVRLGSFELSPVFRAAVRKTDKWRLESRGELQFSSGPWKLNSRLDFVGCKGLSCLGNLETGYSGGKLVLWLRGTLFRVDNWDDRIYVYERDAPGSFNVPAYYGRGWSASLTGTWKCSRRSTFYLRVSYLEYPWMTVDKPSKAEVKLQYALKL